MRVLIILIFSSAVKLPRTTSRIASCIVVITFLPQTHRLLNHAWWTLLSRHSPDSRRFCSQDYLSDRLGQQQIVRSAGKPRSKTAVASTKMAKRDILLAPMHVPSLCRLPRLCPAPLMQRTSATRLHNLGHLERDVTPMVDKRGADLDQFLAQAGQQSWLRRLGHCQRAHEVTEAVEGDATCQVGDEKAAARVQLARMPPDLGHDAAWLAPALRLIGEAGVVTVHFVQRSPDRTLPQIADPVLQCVVGRQPGRVCCTAWSTANSWAA
jgi:hypothetical protein